MRREREPIPRARHPWGWLSGILTLGIVMAGVAAGAVALWENVDVQRLTRVGAGMDDVELQAPQPPPASVASEGDVGPISLYRAAAMEAYFPESDFYPEILERWERLVIEVGGSVRRIGSAADVEDLRSEGLLVVPAAICLGDREVDALRAHAQKGGSLLLTGATGARDDACEWRGWGAIQDLTGASQIREVTRRRGVFMTVPGELPLSPGIEPGARIELRWDGQLAAEMEKGRVYWSDWALNPVAPEETARVDGAALLRKHDAGGRIAWFGFEAGRGVTPLDERRLRTVLTNGVVWTAGIPSAGILPWPGGNQAAFLLAHEVSVDFRNALQIAEVAREQYVPTTFFVASGIALEHPDLAELLQSAGEVATQGVDNSLLAGLPGAEQSIRLRRSVSQIRSWAGADPVGLRPPEERGDEATLQAWRSLGGIYVLGLNAGRTGSPEVLEMEDGRLVLLPRILKDDYNLIVQDGLRRPGTLVPEALAGLAKIRAIGGLAVFSTHSALAVSPALIRDLEEILAAVRAEEGWWIASARDIAEWALARHDATIRIERQGDDRMRLTVRAPEGRSLPDPWIGLHPPGGGHGWAPREDDVPGSYAPTPWGLAIPVGSLAAGETRTIVVERRAPE